MRVLAVAALAVALACLASSPTLAALGGDVSVLVTREQFTCARDHGWSFVSVRGYHSFGAVDVNALPTLNNAAAAGIARRDIYHFPCRSVSPAKQIDDTLRALDGHFRVIWLDIETNPSSGCGWGSNFGSNCQFLAELIAAAKAKGASVGVYSSTYEWGRTVGEACTAGADAGVPLWYAHYDGWKSFGDFSPFGGWHHPTLKQYGDSVGICGLSADADWMP
jgi:GH25 family lysozyme M1 (1,4-beta-N-acetylmuramidase)